MTTRVLVTLHPRTDVAAAVEALTALGAAEVQPPQPELPGVCVATVDDAQQPAAEWAARARQLPGVATAELDQLRWNM